MALPIFTNKEDESLPCLNTSRWIKYIFLSFAQALFREYPAFKWDPNRDVTKIVIQDRFAPNNKNPQVYPQLIFTRGTYRGMQLSMGNLMEGSIDTSAPKKETDLFRGSASFSCIAEDQGTSEHLADMLSFGIYSFREKMKAEGIHKIISIDVGESTPFEILTGNTTINTYNTPVFITFDFQIMYHKNVDYNPDAINHFGLVLSGFPNENDQTIIGEV